MRDLLFHLFLPNCLYLQPKSAAKPLKPAHPIIVDVQVDGPNTFGEAEPKKFGLMQGQMMNRGFQPGVRVCKTRNYALGNMLDCWRTFWTKLLAILYLFTFFFTNPGAIRTTLLLLKYTCLKNTSCLGFLFIYFIFFYFFLFFFMDSFQSYYSKLTRVLVDTKNDLTLAKTA